MTESENSSEARTTAWRRANPPKQSRTEARGDGIRILSRNPEKVAEILATLGITENGGRSI